jgi:glycosyltransferase involved in cell wall biosynthesis
VHVVDEADEVPGLVSVVIPARNAAGTLRAQLLALAAQRTSRPYEVIVADNGSTDGTASVVASCTGAVPGLRLVDAGHRTGTNVARNAGVRAARGAAVLLCDADDVVEPDWLEALASGLERAAAVGGRLERASLSPAFVALWGEPPSDWGVSSYLGFLPRAIGASAGFRRSAWEQVGGFDEDYVRGGTETEFFWRLQLAGHELLDVPEALVHYRMRGDLRSLVRQWYVWGRQSPMLYRDFRGAGLRWSALGAARGWARTAKRLLTAVGGDRRARTLALLQAAEQVGRAVGSVRYRVLFL